MATLKGVTLTLLMGPIAVAPAPVAVVEALESAQVTSAVGQRSDEHVRIVRIVRDGDGIGRAVRSHDGDVRNGRFDRLAEHETELSGTGREPAVRSRVRRHERNVRARDGIEAENRCHRERERQ